MPLTIQKCTAQEILLNPLFPSLRCEYAHESAIAGLPDPSEKMEMYLAMDGYGVLQLYGAFMPSQTLVGFVAVLAPVLPHYGVTIAVCESLFVASAHRKTGAGMRLIRTAEQHAKEICSPGLLVSAPLGGRLATILPRIGYSETNRVFLKRIHHG